MKHKRYYINYNIVLRNIIIILIIATTILFIKFNGIHEDLKDYTSYYDYIKYNNLEDTEQSYKQYLEYLKN